MLIADYALKVVDDSSDFCPGSSRDVPHILSVGHVKNGRIFFLVFAFRFLDMK